MEDNCSCVYVDDYESPTFHQTKFPYARKEHKCGECGRTILKGEKYEYVSSMYDGYFGKYKTCLDCISVRKAFFCHGYLYEGVWEMLAEHICDLRGEISSDCLVPLTKPARERVCELIEEQWENDDE
jgi:hypothetical protein